MKKNAKNDLRRLAKEEVRAMKVRPLLTDPFKEMKIQDGSFLDEVDSRSHCKVCGKSRKYFCYTCYVLLPEIADKVQKVTLPCSIDIIKHPRETDGKSTAAHASIIAPNEVRIFTYPDIPHYDKESNVYLIFPKEGALSLEETWIETPKSPSPDGSSAGSAPTTRVIFIDSTWNQAKRIENDVRLKDLPCLQLNSRETLFWRYQTGKPSTYLATIEAVYYFVRDYHSKFVEREYDGEYDNLLFFFKYMFDKIHGLYGSENLLAYKEL